MDENFVAEMVKAIRLGFQIGMVVWKGVFWLTQQGRQEQTYRRLAQEQRRADQLRGTPTSKVYAEDQ